MAKEQVLLRPWALTDLESARDYLKFDKTAWDPALIGLVNEASAVLERRAGDRRLRSRPYLASATVAGCTLLSTTPATLTTSGSFSAVRAGMFITVTGTPAGEWVASVESPTSLTLQAKATAFAAGLSAAFSCAGPITLDGDGTSEIRLPAGPVTELVAAKVLDDSGVATALNIAGARLDGRSVFLPSDVFPEGRMNIQVQCVAGYSPTLHPERFDALEHACKRLVQVMWGDYSTAIGRGSSVTVQGFGVQFIDAPLPKDIQSIINSFKRWV